MLLVVWWLEWFGRRFVVICIGSSWLLLMLECCFLICCWLGWWSWWWCRCWCWCWVWWRRCGWRGVGCSGWRCLERWVMVVWDVVWSLSVSVLLFDEWCGVFCVFVDVVCVWVWRFVVDVRVFCGFSGWGWWLLGFYWCFCELVGSCWGWWRVCLEFICLMLVVFWWWLFFWCCLVGCCRWGWLWLRWWSWMSGYCVGCWNWVVFWRGWRWGR